VSVVSFSAYGAPISSSSWMTDDGPSECAHRIRSAAARVVVAVGTLGTWIAFAAKSTFADRTAAQLARPEAAENRR
jgi:hypothetical protein